MNQHFVYFILFLLIVGIVLFYFNQQQKLQKQKECFMSSARLTETQIINTPNANVIGGTTVTKHEYTHRPNHSTNVHKLLGDSGQIIILLHNTPFTSEVWRPLYMYTQEQKGTFGKQIPTLITYDLLGFGTAWLPVDPKYNNDDIRNYAWGFNEFVKDLFEIYTAYVDNDNNNNGQNKRKITLVGYGFGGGVAQLFALQYPELIEHLYVLGSTAGAAATGTPDEIRYLVDWIAKNQGVTYLTLEQNFIDQALCIWFENNDQNKCPYPTNKLDTTNTFKNVEYLIGSKMYREASSMSYLQVNKLEAGQNILPNWAEKKVDFPVTFLLGDRDHYISTDVMKDDLKVIEKSSPNVKLNIIKGKHGFVLTHPIYVYNLITTTF